MVSEELEEYVERDIQTTSKNTVTYYFHDFLLKDGLNNVLKDLNFEHPSEVQQLCIPKAILGADLLCQAKSGTGKTAVFVISVLQQLSGSDTQAVVIVHTKEMCQQIMLEFSRFAKNFPDVVIMDFYGGVDIERDLERLGCKKDLVQDQKHGSSFSGSDNKRSNSRFTYSHINSKDSASIDISTQQNSTKHSSQYQDRFKGSSADKSKKPTIFIGTAGRTLDLLKRGAISFENVKHFIIDEVDELIVDLNNRKCIQDIFFRTPLVKQTMLFTATLTPELKDVCLMFLRDPLVICIDEEKKLTLHGLVQFYATVPSTASSYSHIHKDSLKFKLLEAIIDNTEFNQMIIFTANKTRCEILTKLLRFNEFPAIDIHANLDIRERMKRFLRFKTLAERILVTTNLMARGIDVCEVNVVINFDMPECAETYLHRVGRAGRFETKGVAISLVETVNDKSVMNDVQSRFEVSIKEMDLPTK